MAKPNNYTLEQIHKNLIQFNKKICSMGLDSNFWIIADRSDFKPLKKINIEKKKEIKTNIHSIKEIKDNLLKIKGEYYKNKKFSEIKIVLDTNILDKVNDIRQYINIKNKVILTVYITIFLIRPNGTISFDNKRELIVKYIVDDFRTLNYKLKNVEVLMRLCADSVITTNTIEGISYRKLLKKVKLLK